MRPVRFIDAVPVHVLFGSVLPDHDLFPVKFQQKIILGRELVSGSPDHLPFQVVIERLSVLLQLIQDILIGFVLL